MKIINTKFKDLKIISQNKNSDSRGNLRETFKCLIVLNIISALYDNTFKIKIYKIYVY